MSPQVMAILGGILAGTCLVVLLIRLLAKHFITTMLSLGIAAGIVLMGYAAVLYTKAQIDEKVAVVTAAVTAPQQKVQSIIDGAQSLLNQHLHH